MTDSLDLVFFDWRYMIIEEIIFSFQATIHESR